MRAARKTRAALAAMTVIIACATVSAHRRDEYLQAARIAIDPDRVQIALDLTPGIAIADRIATDIDVDANRSISAAEAQAYAEGVLSAIALDIDGTPLRLELLDCAVASIESMRQGEGTARIHALALMPRVAGGPHHLRYRNNYRPDIGVYLANSLVSTNDRVIVASQQRDVNQRELVVDYTLRTDSTMRLRQGLPLGAAGTLVLLTNVWWRRLGTPKRRGDEPRDGGRPRGDV